MKKYIVVLFVLFQVVLMVNELYSQALGIEDVTPDAVLEVSGNGGTSDLFMLSADDADDGNLMIVKNSGNVGIGVITPASLLNLYQNNTLTGAGAGLTVEQDGTGDAVTQYLLTGSQRWVLGIDNSDGDKFKFAADADLNTNSVFTIQTDGNVGVGTASPTSTFEITGAANSRGFLFSTSDVNAGNVPFDISLTDAGTANIIGNRTGLTNNTTSGTQEIVQFINNNGSGVTETILEIQNADPDYTTISLIDAQNSAGTSLFTVRGDGNVGIGNNTPLAFLDLPAATASVSSLRITPSGTVDASPNTGDIYSDGTNLFYYNGSGWDDLTNTGGASFWSRSAPDVYLGTLTDNVGIGLNSPTSTFHVYDNDANVDATVGLTVEQDGTGDAISQYLLSGGQRWVLGIDNSDGDKFKLASDADLNTNPKLTIQTDGNVGIGVSSPTQLMQLQNAGTDNYLKIDAGATAANYAGIMLTEHDINWGWTLRQNAADDDFHISYQDNTPTFTDVVTATRTGNVGIGTTAPGARFHIEDLTNSVQLLEFSTNNQDVDIRIGEDNDGGYGFYWRYMGTQTGNDNELELWSENQAGADIQVYEIEQDGEVNFAQNVGVGTDSPARKLDVRGTIIGALPLVAFASCKDDHNAVDEDMMAFMAANVPSTNNIWVKCIQDAGNTGMNDMETEGEYSGAWVDFGDPSNGGAGYAMDLDIEIESDGTDDDDDQFGACIVVRWSDGTIYVKCTDDNDERDDRIDDEFRWDDDGTNGWHSWAGPGM